MLEVEVIGDGGPGAPLPGEVERLVALALASAGVEDGHVAVEFVAAGRIAELNEAHRDTSGPTDVLSFPIDEAQNTTPEQMKMFLTRLGFGSRMVVTGDITQIDLPREQKSGLIVVEQILEDVEGVDFVRFGGADVVRHRLVQRIVEAYDAHTSAQATDLRPAERRRA